MPGRSKVIFLWNQITAAAQFDGVLRSVNERGYFEESVDDATPPAFAAHRRAQIAERDRTAEKGNRPDETPCHTSADEPL